MAGSEEEAALAATLLGGGAVTSGRGSSQSPRPHDHPCLTPGGQQGGSCGRPLGSNACGAGQAESCSPRPHTAPPEQAAAAAAAAARGAERPGPARSSVRGAGALGRKATAASASDRAAPRAGGEAGTGPIAVRRAASGLGPRTKPPHASHGGLHAEAWAGGTAPAGSGALHPHQLGARHGGSHVPGASWEGARHGIDSGRSSPSSSRTHVAAAGGSRGYFGAPAPALLTGHQPSSPAPPGAGGLTQQAAAAAPAAAPATPPAAAGPAPTSSEQPQPQQASQAQPRGAAAGAPRRRQAQAQARREVVVDPQLLRQYTARPPKLHTPNNASFPVTSSDFVAFKTDTVTREGAPNRLGTLLGFAGSSSAPAADALGGDAAATGALSRPAWAWLPAAARPRPWPRSLHQPGGGTGAQSARGAAVPGCPGLHVPLLPSASCATDPGSSREVLEAEASHAGGPPLDGMPSTETRLPAQQQQQQPGGVSARPAAGAAAHAAPVPPAAGLHSGVGELQPGIDQWLTPPAGQEFKSEWAAAARGRALGRQILQWSLQAR